MKDNTEPSIKGPEATGSQATRLEADGSEMSSEGERVAPYPWHLLTSYRQEEARLHNTLYKTCRISTRLERLQELLERELQQLDAMPYRLEFTGLRRLVREEPVFTTASGTALYRIPTEDEGVDLMLELPKRLVRHSPPEREEIQQRQEIAMRRSWKRLFALKSGYVLSFRGSLGGSETPEAFRVHATAATLERLLSVEEGENSNAREGKEVSGITGVELQAEVVMSRIKVSNGRRRTKHALGRLPVLEEVVILGRKEEGEATYQVIGEVTVKGHSVGIPIECRFESNKEKWSFRQASQHGSQMENAMSHYQGNNNSRELPLTLEVIIAEQTIRVEELLNCEEDLLLRLEQGIGDEVTLRVEGKRYARGELVEIGGNLGVRLTEMYGER